MKTVNLYQLFRPRCDEEFKWSPPFAAVSDELALSALTDMASTHPELTKSYIYRVGRYNTTTGKITLHRSPVLLKNKPKNKNKKVEKNEVSN